MKQHLVMMTRFNAWANRLQFGEIAKLDDADYAGDVGLFFGSVHRTLNHILLVDRLWIARINDQVLDVTSLDEELYVDRQGLAHARIAEDALYIELVDQMDEAALARPVQYEFSDSEKPQLDRVDVILMTLFNHQTHHRGQIHAALTQRGIRPPDADILDYLIEQRSSPDSGLSAP